MKILIIGHCRHGKDTLALYLREKYHFCFVPTSLLCAEIFTFEELRGKYKYLAPIDCFEDRRNHREEWFQLINDYNRDNHTKLIENILKTNDIYIGLRNREQLKACKEKKIFDLIIWVDASERLPLESKASMELVKEDADIILYNNESEEEFFKEVEKILLNIFKTLN